MQSGDIGEEGMRVPIMRSTGDCAFYPFLLCTSVIRCDTNLHLEWNNH